MNKSILHNRKKPAICVPLTSQTEAEIILEAKSALDEGCEIIEWRVDLFENYTDFRKVFSVLLELSDIMGDIPLIFTFRTENEGGRYIEKEYYGSLLRAAIVSGKINFVDIEIDFDPSLSIELLKFASENNIPSIASYHNFGSTPSADDIIEKFSVMQNAGADILKIAAMPNSAADILTLLHATNSYHSENPEIPLITMSMGSLGVISRVSGEVFGSCLTFATVENSSAPGQLNIKDVKKMLDIFSQ